MKVNYSDIEKYGNNGSAGFFSLKNDGDVARVRFLYNRVEDIAAYAVHSVKVDDKDRYVSCLRAYDEPKDCCPLCQSGASTYVKLYIPIYNVDEDKIQLWERGKKFFSKISGVCARYSKAPIVSQIFEIERHGKPNDQQTQYEIFRTDDPADNTTLEDFEMPSVEGAILEKSFEELQTYVNTGSFDGTDNVVRRGTRQADGEQRRPSRTPQRRGGF